MEEGLIVSPDAGVFSSRRRHKRSSKVSWARRCVEEKEYREQATHPGKGRGEKTVGGGEEGKIGGGEGKGGEKNDGLGEGSGGGEG